MSKKVKRARPSTPSTSSAPVLLHEVEDKTLRHRIVIVVGGTTDVGPWAEAHELAKHKNYLANVDDDSPLPRGIFTVRAVPTNFVW